jgi:predicted transcriptional regulator
MDDAYRVKANLPESYLHVFDNGMRKEIAAHVLRSTHLMQPDQYRHRADNPDRWPLMALLP